MSNNTPMTTSRPSDDDPPTSTKLLSAALADGQATRTTSWHRPAWLTERARWWLTFSLVLYGIYIFAFVIRAFSVLRSYEVFFDELIYLQISQNMANGLGLRYYTSPFYLHPPLFFIIEGGLLNLINPEGNIIYTVYAVRFLNTTFAALSAILIYLIGRAAAGWKAGLIAAVVFMVEPFILRINSRNLLETNAMFWALLGYCILMYTLRHNRTRWAVVGAGLAFGLALLSKEPTIFVTALPLGVMFVFNWVMPRRATFWTGVLMLSVYALYPLTVMLVGDRAQFFKQKLDGVNRVLGLVRESGFNQLVRGGDSGSGGRQAPSFVAALLQNLDQFATTYVLIALGALAICVLFFLQGRLIRFIFVLGGCAYFKQAYNLTLGENEEQYYYYLIIPAILAISVGVVALARQRPVFQTRPFVTLYAVASILFLGWTGYGWIERRTTEDNGYQNLVTFFEQHVPAGSKVSTTTNTSLELFKTSFFASNFTSGVWASPEAIAENNVEYVIISTRLIQTGYDAGTPELEDWLGQNAVPVFVYNGPTSGDLILYQIPPEARVAALAK